MTRLFPILVTGGAGFIGSHACKALSLAGYLPVTVDNLSTGHADAVKWGPFVNADVRDQSALGETIREHGIKAVMHFAASAYVGESVDRPVFYYDNNAGGMISLINACVGTGIEQIVLSSSCATYGTPADCPIRENTPQAPINPYGRSKLMCEEMLRDCSAAHGLRFAALRYFNAAGADPEGELCERHDPETHLLPLALQAASGQRGPLQVFGTDYPTRDGSCERDYIHVSDLARGHVLAAGYLAAGGPSTALNLGSGTGHTVFEVLAAIQRVTGAPVPHKQARRRPGDPPSLTADATLASETLGFRTERSGLEQIISDAAPSFGLADARKARDGRHAAE
ncbi:UDP-glucose 4-epimerase GalE [Leisingera sp. ANG59]|uniref:UDP-glucose 4-epimerase GalE n=1 Tax=Leisingera sp. ANG59 TaxID=2675221 RepID=UPI001573A9E8|nr:UDP-glucose 4-epimerase GalE [Leisingera sp. ANG59]NSY39853.1 UDP-glucose 4-epimerase GalE [Leisingera sp. ANG59]